MTAAELSATADAVVAWLLTYAVHSTVLLLAAWLVSSLLRDRRLGIQEAVWKAALLGGLLTASLQLVLAPGAPVVVLRSHDPAAVSAASPAGGAAGLAAAAGDAGAAPVPGEPAMQDGDPAGWTVPVLLVWLAGAAGFVLALAVSALGLHRLLRGRRAVESGALGQLFARLLARAGRRRKVALSESGAVETPFAFGVLRAEVCVPERVATDLAPRLQEGLLAHELGHVLRRDPAWLTVSRVVEGVFFFQPLNRLARRRLEELSEFLCDDWAVAQTGRGIALARCLAEVAVWTHGERAGRLSPGRAGAAALAGDGSPLARRVGRIMSRVSEADSRRPLWTIPTVLAALAAVILFAPGAVSSPPAPAPAPVAAPAPPAAPAAAAPAAPAAVVPAAVAPAPVAPADEPAPTAPPAPPGEPAPTAAPAAPAPEVPDAEAIEAEVRREVQGSRSERERVREIEAEIRRTVREMRPEREEIERLARELSRRRGLSEEQRRALQKQAQEVAEQHRLTEAERQELRERAQELAGQHRLSEDQLRELREHAREMAERHRLTEAERQELRRTAQEMAEQRRLTEAERQELRKTAQEMVEQHRLSEEELKELHEQARRAAEAAKPSLEELQRLQRELAELQRHLEQELAKQTEEGTQPPPK